MALHLHLVRPSQQEKISKRTKGTVTNPHMQASLHHVGQKAAHDGSARIVMHVGYHGFTVLVVKAYGVIVIFVKERPVLPLHQGIIFQPLRF